MKDKEYKEHIDCIQLRLSASYREQVCRMIYQNTNLKNQIYKLVLGNSGSQEEAEDIFQEAITVLFKRVMKDQNFILRDNVEGYIYGTARNIFYTAKKRNIKYTELNESGLNEQVDDPDIGYDHIEIAANVLRYATKTCKQVLMYWAANCTMREIATLMNYKSEVMARKKKYECIQKLTRYFEQNPALADKILGHD